VHTFCHHILATAGFELTKRSANDPRLLEQQTNSTINFSTNDDVKVLGFFWNCKSDELKYRVKIPNDNVAITKRSIFSTVAKIFDPLRLINLVVVKAKILLQQMWILKLDWDQPVPKEIETVWRKMLDELVDLNNYRISRKLMSSSSPTLLELHGFSDASSKAYGAAVYLKTTDIYGNVFVTLLCAKSKVAPIIVIKGVMKAFVARGVTLGLETSVDNTLGSQTLIMPVVHITFYVRLKF
jgi:hypothetical protein